MQTVQSLQELQAGFSLPGALRFEEAPGGLARAVAETPLAQAIVYCHGAHVAHFQPAGHKPVLFTSSRGFFEPGKPIRGGIPICFPWFGPRVGDPSSPMHGFARILPWTVQSTARRPDGTVEIVFELKDCEQTRAIWPVAFEARYSVTIGAELGLALEVTNRSSQQTKIEEALHTYFAISDIHQIAISGLAGTTYLDKTDRMKRTREESPRMRFGGETDRVYLHTEATCILDDPGYQRRIIIEKTGSNTTVVWNPWAAKARALSDFGPDEWSGMACIETANALEDALVLDPGQTHRMEARIYVEAKEDFRF